jgi:predicted O-linked N-acetylglucosamine transferase (SPINDLY family)
MRLGVALAAAGQHAEAVTQLRTVVEATPADAEAWNSLAFSLRAVGQNTEALAAYEKTVQLKPDYFDAIDRLGALVSDLKGLSAGIPYFRRAVALKPDYAGAWCNLGLALTFERKYKEPLNCFARALAIDPKLVPAQVGRGLVYQQSYRLKEALATYTDALKLQPENPEARTGKLLTLNYLSGLNRSEVFNEHVEFGRVLNIEPAQIQSLGRSDGSRVRLAFLSPDLRTHSVAYFLEPILRYLNRAQFEVILYHDHFQVDAMSERLRGLADLWRNFVGQAHASVEATIRSDAPDILVDLAGHTGSNRLPVFARRVAPVQISYLGYPNTTGLREMDYRLTDAITDPDEEDQRFHTEKLIRFAPCAWAYLPPENAPAPVKPVTAEVTFGSFNNFAKASDDTLRLWGRVLAGVPDSRLLLKAHCLDDPELGEIVEGKLKLLGIDRSRIELLDRTPNLQSHLALYNRVDIALDTFPYHGTTTTCEALWMGMPVVTLVGDRHASRVSASLLTAAGHPDWIAHSEDEYARIAIELANDPTRRASLRSSLRDDLRRSLLLDHASHAAHFGAALLACVPNQLR